MRDSFKIALNSVVDKKYHQFITTEERSKSEMFTSLKRVNDETLYSENYFRFHLEQWSHGDIFCFNYIMLISSLINIYVFEN